MTSISSRKNSEIEVPAIPDFSRLPFRSPENANYRDDGPPRAANNPLYLAIPGPRTMGDVRKIIEIHNPKFHPAVRNLSPEIRKERIDDVETVLFAMRHHIKLEEMVMATIRNSFVERPWNNYYIQESAVRAHNIGDENIIYSNSGAGAVGSGGIFGGPGVGKTVLIKTILLACPQTILHTNFRGRRIGVQQIVWLYLSMPPKASAYGLLAWIASTLDYILGTKYRQEVDNAKNYTQQVRIVASRLAIHTVGVIFCDEFQNIKVGSKTERQVLENTLQELINYTHTRWVFIGTKDARSSIQSDALLRRMVGERGQITWNPMNQGAEWDSFLESLWGWQTTTNKLKPNAEISAMMHRLSGGVPDYAKKLFTAAQANIIGNSKFPDELITADILHSTMMESFSERYARQEARFKAQQQKIAREKQKP